MQIIKKIITLTLLTALVCTPLASLSAMHACEEMNTDSDCTDSYWLYSQTPNWPYNQEISAELTSYWPADPASDAQEYFAQNSLADLLTPPEKIEMVTAATNTLFDSLDFDHDGGEIPDIDDVTKALEDGANVNAYNPRSGDTVLMEAVQHHEPELIQLLIQNNAHINATNKHNINALAIAAKPLAQYTYDNEKNIEDILQDDSLDEETHEAWRKKRDQPRIVSMLISQGADFFDEIDLGMIAPHYDPPIRELLLRHFACQNRHIFQSPDCIRNAIYGYATQSNPIKIVELQVNQQKGGTCGLHALANIKSINQIIEANLPIMNILIKENNTIFYQQVISSISSLNKPSDIDIQTMGTIDQELMVLATKTLSMDNCCTFNRNNKSFRLYTANQHIDYLKNDGANNYIYDITCCKKIYDMIDHLKKQDAGAVHFICDISDDLSLAQAAVNWELDHWITISLIKEKGHWNVPYILYTDSNNIPLAKQPDAWHCMQFIIKHYYPRWVS